METKIKKYLQKQLTKEDPSTVFNRTEDGVRYSYSPAIGRTYDLWANEQRNIGIVPSFSQFYSNLAGDVKQRVSTTNAHTQL